MPWWDWVVRVAAGGSMGSTGPCDTCIVNTGRPRYTIVAGAKLNARGSVRTRFTEFALQYRCPVTVRLTKSHSIRSRCTRSYPLTISESIRNAFVKKRSRLPHSLFFLSSHSSLGSFIFYSDCFWSRRAILLGEKCTDVSPRGTRRIRLKEIVPKEFYLHSEQGTRGNCLK